MIGLGTPVSEGGNTTWSGTATTPPDDPLCQWTRNKLRASAAFGSMLAGTGGSNAAGSASCAKVGRTIPCARKRSTERAKLSPSTTAPANPNWSANASDAAADGAAARVMGPVCPSRWLNRAARTAPMRWSFGLPLFLVQVVAAAQSRRDAHDRRQLAPRRRVGGEEAGHAGEDQRRLVRPLGPRQRLAHTGLVHLVPVEPGVLVEEGGAEGGDQRAAIPTAPHEAVGHCPG